MSNYQETYARWARDPVAFWQREAEAIAWVRTPTIGFDPDDGPCGRWFVDGSATPATMRWTGTCSPAAASRPRSFMTAR